MKNKISQLALLLAVNSSFVHIACHVRLACSGAESKISALKGIVREFNPRRISLY